MHYEVNQEIINTIREARGEVKGVVFDTDKRFILNKEGEEGLKKVEKEMEDMGVPFSYNEVKGSEYYPLGMRILSLIAISRAFNLSVEKVKEMGSRAPLTSFVVRFFAKYMFSAESVFKKAADIWSKHYTVGELEGLEMNKEEKRATIRVKDLVTHPILCDYLSGYFSSLVNMAEGAESRVEETKCYFKGDEYHEFLIKW